MQYVNKIVRMLGFEFFISNATNKPGQKNEYW